MTIVMATVMVLAAVPAGLALGAWTGEGGSVPRETTNDENDLIIPLGESFDLSGTHSYAVSVQILGTLNIKPWDGADAETGMLSLKAPKITIGPSGRIAGDGRGYGGGGGGCTYQDSNAKGGKAGVGGKGGDGGNAYSYYSSYRCGGGGGGSNLGLGGSGYYGGTAGDAGTELKGGNGGVGSSYKGGDGGPGFGGGGGGGGAYYTGAGGGGGGGSGGKDASSQAGGNGGGSYAGTGGTATSGGYTTGVNGKNGGYMAPESNGDFTTDMSVVRGSGGGGGGGMNYGGGGAGGGGAGGASVQLEASETLTISGSITTTGGGGGKGGEYAGSYYGGDGGGGAGGGVALTAKKITITGTVDALGKMKQAPDAANGGTIKMAYADKDTASAKLYGGRIFANGMPRMQGLLSPPNGGEVAPIPTFMWNPGIDADKDPLTYHLQVATVEDFATTAIDEAGLRKTSYISPGPLASGTTYYWRVAAYDPVGPGPWSEVWTFSIDVTPPVSKVDDLPKFTTADEFELTWSGTDNALGISTFTIYVSDNNQGFIPWLKDTPKTSAIFLGVEGHNYRFFSTATDRAGNREGAHLQADALTTIDTRPPVSTLELMSPYLNTTMIPVAWSAKDNTSGVANYSVFVSTDNGEFMPWLSNTLQKGSTYTGAEGHMYQFYVRAYDNAGNFEGVPDSGSFLTVRVDLTPPATSISMGWPTYGERPVYILPQNELTFSQGDNYAGVNNTFYIIDGQLVKEYNGPFRETQFGPHTITFWSADMAGNEETRQTLSFFTDGEAPASSLEFEGPNFTKASIVYIAGTTLILLSAKDRGSGVNRTEYNFGSGDRQTYTEPFKLRTTGSVILYYRSTDNLGTAEHDKNIRLALDTTAPVTTPSYPVGAQNRDISVRLTASDYESGLAGTFYRVLKGGEVVTDWTPGTEVSLAAETDHSKDGTYRVEFYSTDGVGNSEAVKHVTVIIDTQAALTVGIKGGETADKETFTVKGKAEPGARVSINQKPVTVLNDGTFTAVVVLKSGSNKLSITSTDPAGNSVTVTKTVNYNAPFTLGPNLVMMLVVVLIVVAVAGAALALRRKPN
jgi:hypothetical protein